jgi:4-amino-4-deoxy-L-arabinose transferase-like glycosyltransferase
VKTLAARNGGRAGLAALTAILLLGLGLRIDNAWQGRSPVYDAAAYARIAANLERDDGFTLGPTATQPATNYSPGLPLLTAGLYELSGGIHERLARLVLAFLGSLAVLFTYLIGRRLAGPWAGVVGAAAVAIYPALLEYQGMIMSEPLAATLLAGAVLAMLWADQPGARVLSRGGGVGRVLGFSPGSPTAIRERDRGEKEDAALSRHPLPTPPARRWIAPGLLLGALALTRPEYLAIAVPIAVVVFARDGRASWKAGLAQAMIMLLGLALVVAPWTVRNAVAMGRFVPISTGGGQVLFAGSYMPSGGDPEKVGQEVVERHPELFEPGDLQRLRLEQILAVLAAHRFPGTPTDEALGRMGRERLWEDVSTEPVAYAGFLGSKLWLIWGHGPRDVMRQPVWAVLHWALLAFGLIGFAALAWRRRWEALLLAVVLISATAVGELLVATPRRALVTIPLLAALAGAGAVCLLQPRIRH